MRPHTGLEAGLCHASRMAFGDYQLKIDLHGRSGTTPLDGRPAGAGGRANFVIPQAFSGGYPSLNHLTPDEVSTRDR